MLPKGFIQSATNPLPPSTCNITNPNINPITIPIKIFQCNASFFIVSVINILVSYWEQVKNLFLLLDDYYVLSFNYSRFFQYSAIEFFFKDSFIYK